MAAFFGTFDNGRYEKIIKLINRTENRPLQEKPNTCAAVREHNVVCSLELWSNNGLGTLEFNILKMNSVSIFSLSPSHSLSLNKLVFFQPTIYQKHLNLRRFIRFYDPVL